MFLHVPTGCYNAEISWKHIVLKQQVLYEKSKCIGPFNVYRTKTIPKTVSLSSLIPLLSDKLYVLCCPTNYMPLIVQQTMCPFPYCPTYYTPFIVRRTICPLSCNRMSAPYNVTECLPLIMQQTVYPLLSNNLYALYCPTNYVPLIVQ